MFVDHRTTLEPMLAARFAMNRFLREAMADSGFASFGERRVFPVDVFDRQDRLEVRAVLPGCRPEDIEIEASMAQLIISAERYGDAVPAQDWVTHDSRPSHLQRTVRLPVAVKPEAAFARCENGELVVTLPKTDHAQVRRIPVENTTADQPKQADEAAAIGAPERQSAAARSAGVSSTDKADETSRTPRKPVEAPNGGTNTPPDTYEPANEVEDDPVTAQSMESFPASDPPSWSPERS